MSRFNESVKAVLLVGGLGTRLRSVVPSTPKPLALVGDRPFLELLVRQLSYQGIRHLVLCTGYLADEIEKQLGDGHALDVRIDYSKEPHTLGTAGAVKFAAPLLTDVSDFLVMNGDSFMEMDFQELIHFHRKSSGLASMAVVRMKNQMRYGTVEVTTGNRVSGFREKHEGILTEMVNAGVYVFNRRIFEHIPEGPASLERDVFPRLIDHGVYALEKNGLFIDIGTPEDYARAQELAERLSKAGRRDQTSGISD
jgi:D-glycero-alpha-D-manno-heptose 1-phosphate guanylyltransferase